VVSAPITEEAAWSALRAAVPALDRYVSEGSIEIHPSREWYLDHARFNRERIIDWTARLERARSRGYPGMRVSENTVGLEKKDWRDFCEYETQLNRSLAARPLIALCTYPLLTSGAVELFDVARTHELVIARRQGSWEVFETSQLKRAKAEVARLKAELKADLAASIRLHQLSTRLLAGTDLPLMLEEVLDATIALQHADFGNVQIYNPDTKALHIVAQRGFRRDFLDYFDRVQEGEAACGQALQRGDRVVIEDVELDAGFAPHRPIAASAGFRAVQSTPLFNRDGEPLGMISTHFRTPHRPSERDLLLTDLHARQAAELIERKRGEDARARQIVQRARLAAAAMAIRGASSPDEICQAVADKAREVVGAHVAVIGTTVDGDWAKATHTVSVAPESAPYRVFDGQTDGSGIYAMLDDWNRPIRMTRMELDAHPIWRRYGIHLGQHFPLRGWLAVPLAGAEGRNIGLLQLADKADGEFTSEDEAVIVQLAQVASVAIEEGWLLEALRKSEAELSLVAEAIPHQVWSVLPDGSVSYCNQRWTDYTGLTLADTQADGWTACLHPDDIDTVLTTWREALSSAQPFELEHRIRGSDCHYRRFLSRALPLRDERGQIVQWFGTNTDVEERRQAAEALHQAQTQLVHVARRTTMGQLAASLAHELNQPLAAVAANGSACLRWLTRSEPDLDEAKRAVQHIVRDAKRAAEVVAQTRALLTRSDGDKSALDVVAVVREVLALVHPELLRQRVTVSESLASDLPFVLGNRVQLQQVVLNLVVNGIEAMRHVPERDRVMVVRAAAHLLDDVPGVLVAVQDAGVGVAPQHLDRIFDAFYTTKEDGLGMGLSISRSIIQAHGGRLWLTANSGPGATVQFVLPCRPERTNQPLVSLRPT
jgi:PAS domain S-box-containing protein